MLKKIVKYGNSSAIVLDKAILELLNMREGSIVKISTDGKSLLLTPHEPAPAEQVSPTATSQEIFLDCAVENLKGRFKKNHPETSTSELKKMAEEAKAKLLKCADEYAALEKNSEYQKELSLLKEKYRDAPIKLANEVATLQQRHAPQLCAMAKELDASPIAQVGHEAIEKTADAFKEEAEKLQKKYMAIHEKYRSARDAFAKLENNEEYQHKNALLAQQQAKPIDVKKYTAAMTELACKYVPEWRAYQDELLKAAQEYEKKIEKHKAKKKAS